MIKRINDSAYVLNLLESFDVCPIFNIEYLVAYKGPGCNPSNLCLMSLSKILLLREPPDL